MKSIKCIYCGSINTEVEVDVEDDPVYAVIWCHSCLKYSKFDDVNLDWKEYVNQESDE